MLEVKRLAITMLAAVLAASAALSNVAISRNSTSDGVEYFTQKDFEGCDKYLRCKLGFIKQGGKEYIAFRYENGGDLSVMYETLPLDSYGKLMATFDYMPFTGASYAKASLNVRVYYSFVNGYSNADAIIFKINLDEMAKAWNKTTRAVCKALSSGYFSLYVGNRDLAVYGSANAFASLFDRGYGETTFSNVYQTVCNNSSTSTTTTETSSTSDASTQSSSNATNKKKYNSKGGFYYQGIANGDPLAASSKLKSLKEAIDGWKECKGGVITDSGAGVAVYKSNGYQCASAPESLSSSLKEANDGRHEIVDVCITEANSYIMFYGLNGYSYKGSVPQGLKDAIQTVRSKTIKTVSASFNEAGEWCLVSENGDYYCSESVRWKIAPFVKDFGKLCSVTLTENALVACYQNGVYYYNVNPKVEQSLSSINFKPKYVKFTDKGLLLITDGVSRYTYFL
ncbi:MAG: hypothetical protein ACI4UL_09540 [Muribaculaceae bacterium]